MKTAIRLGFIEKCASIGVNDLDMVALLLVRTELDGSFEKAALAGETPEQRKNIDYGKTFRQKPLNQTSVMDMPNVGMEDLPRRYAGMGIGGALGGLLGHQLGGRYGHPGLGALVGAGALGYLGEKFGQPLLSKALPSYFANPA